MQELIINENNKKLSKKFNKIKKNYEFSILTITHIVRYNFFN